MKLLISAPAKKVLGNELTKKSIKFSETFGTRHYMTFMLFLGMANAYIMRTNMSIAIVSMVTSNEYICFGCCLTFLCVRNVMNCRSIIRQSSMALSFWTMSVPRRITEKKV